MTTAVSEGIVSVAAGDNALQALHDRAASAPDAPAMLVSDGAGITTLTSADVVARVRAIAAGIVRAGVEPGDRVVIFSHARLEWALVDYAIWQAGAVSVTIYETSSSEQAAWVVENSGARLAFAENDELAGVLESARATAPSLERIITIEDDLDAFTVDDRDAALDAELDQRAAAIELDDPATIVYTSGTTGRSKGCALSHLNLIWTIRQVIVTEPELVAPGNRTLTFLPLAHILARVVQLTAVTGGVPVAFGGGIRTLLADLKAVRPTWLTVVPRVLEKVYDGAAQQAGTGIKRRIFDRAAHVAREVGACREAGATPSPVQRLEHRAADPLVYTPLRRAMGGALRYVISGGAPLNADLARFFGGVGVEVLEGYGLTETTGPATVHRAGHSKPGTVGPPLAGVDAKVSDVGEILLRGNCVFGGYWDNDEATDEAFVDGYFRTGDYGEIDGDGHVVITGRMKDLIVTAGGKNIAPAPLENAIAAHPLVSHAVVVGDDRPFVSALLTLDDEALVAWARAHDRVVAEPSRLAVELADDAELLAELQGAVDAANSHVSRAEGVRAFRLLPADLTVASGELTPTMKVKRATVVAGHAALVEQIYGGH